MGKCSGNDSCQPILASPDFHAGESSISEEITSYLDGEASGTETQIALKMIRDFPDIRKEAQDIQRAWDLLDFLPTPKSPEVKTLETVSIVLRESGFGTNSLEESDFGDKDQEITVPPPVSLGSIFGTGSIRRRFSNRFLPWAVLFAALGGAMGVLAFGGLRYIEARQTEKMIKYIGIVNNLQILRDAQDLDFLRDLAVPELFGPPGGGEGP